MNPQSDHCIFLHALHSTSSSPGIQVTLVVQPREFYEGVDPDYLVPNTAYLSIVEKNEEFVPFYNSLQTALAMPIQVYLELLLFFETVWPKIENEMKDQLMSLYRNTKKFAINNMEIGIKSKLRTTCVYEHWFDTIYLQAVRTTDQRHQAIHIQRCHTSVKLDSNLWREMSSNRLNLIKALKERNYNFRNVAETRTF